MDLGKLLRNNVDRAIAIGLAVAGLIAIGVGWLGVSDAVLPAQQIPYLASGGLIGLFLLGAGATLWLSADLRDEWRKLDEVADELRALREETATPAPEPAPASVRRRNGRLSATSDAG